MYQTSSLILKPIYQIHTYPSLIITTINKPPPLTQSPQNQKKKRKMKFLTLILFVFLCHLSSAFPHNHELNKRQIDKLDKLSYVLADSDLGDGKHEPNALSIEDNSEQQINNKIQNENNHIKQSTVKTPSVNSNTAINTSRYSNLVTKIIKQILSKRTVNESNNNNEYRKKTSVEQIEKNDLIRSSIIDKKFKYLSELTLRKLKPAFELQLPSDLTQTEQDELVNDINRFINEDGSFRRRDGRRR